MILIVDIDGTIADTMTAWRMAVWEAYRVVIRETDITQFNSSKATYDKVRIDSPFPPQSYEEYDDFLWKRCFWNPEFYRNLLPLDGLWEPLLGWDGPIIFLTTRHPKLQIETEAWLVRWGFLSDDRSQVILMKDKHLFIEELSKHYSEEQILFIDDKMKTMLNVAKLKLPNVRMLIPKRPWNSPTGSPETKAEWDELFELRPGHNVKIASDIHIVEEIFE